ncbi:hypothetical protein GE061_002807 [Apolygus lucorum]|uniref:Uncharacterized protein n=1 Tax=Apolygus lucorum TaxID=248454 RepID=A0A8S9X8S1_APOLU|nr:hypothetical protein GE061_002807 [Apolygus lucorum]
MGKKVEELRRGNLDQPLEETREEWVGRETTRQKEEEELKKEWTQLQDQLEEEPQRKELDGVQQKNEKEQDMNQMKEEFLVDKGSKYQKETQEEKYEVVDVKRAKYQKTEYGSENGRNFGQVDEESAQLFEKPQKSLKPATPFVPSSVKDEAKTQLELECGRSEPETQPSSMSFRFEDTAYGKNLKIKDPKRYKKIMDQRKWYIDDEGNMVNKADKKIIVVGSGRNNC